MLPAFQALSNWQWHRLSDRQIYNVQIQEQIDKPPVLIEEVLTTVGDAKVIPDHSQWRTVELTGVWLQTDQVLVRKKSLESDLGLWVVTPLKLTDGTVAVSYTHLTLPTIYSV